MYVMVMIFDAEGGDLVVTSYMLYKLLYYYY